MCVQEMGQLNGTQLLPYVKQQQASVKQVRLSSLFSRYERDGLYSHNQVGHKEHSPESTIHQVRCARSHIIALAWMIEQC